MRPNNGRPRLKLNSNKWRTYKSFQQSIKFQKRKLTSLGDVEKWKARLVAKGFSQQYGVDWNENFAPTPQTAGIRLLIVFILHFGLMHMLQETSVEHF
eukprot:6682-Pelagococcus_subviridis.AAC.1